MMRRTVRATVATTLATLSVWAVVAYAQGGDGTPAQARAKSEAYVALIRADRARDGGNVDVAVEKYEQALALYQGLLRTYPGWRADMFEYRVTYCGNQIAALSREAVPEPVVIEERIPEPVAVPQPTPQLVADAERTSEQNRALEQENKYLRTRIDSLEDELAESAGPENTEELDRLQGENAGLQQQLDAALSQIQQAGQADDEVAAQQRKELHDLRVELKQVEQERTEATRTAARLESQVASMSGQVERAVEARKMAESKRDAQAGEVAALQRELKKARASVTAMESAGGRDAEQVRTLAEERDALQTELAALRDQAKANEKDLARLRKENEKLASTSGQSAGRVGELSAKVSELEAAVKTASTEQSATEDLLARLEKEKGTLEERTVEQAEALEALQARLAGSLAEGTAAAGELERVAARNVTLEKTAEEAAQLRDTVAELQGQLKTAHSQDRASSAQLATVTRERDEYAGQVNNLTTQLAGKDEAHREALAAADANSKAMGRIRSENVSLTRRAQALETDNERLAERTASDSQLLTAVRRQNRQVREEFRRVEKEAEQMAREISQARRNAKELAMLRQERLALAKENLALEKELEALSKLHEARKDLLDALRAKDAELY